jgi:glucose-6-phosphate 1-dehydrogenase
VIADVNPLRAGLRLARVPEPSALVIFGGTGDLTARKLMPALYDLARQRLLPAAFAVVGIGRAHLSDTEYRAQLREAVARFSRSRPIDEDVWRSFADRLFYVSVRTEDGYDELGRRLDGFDRELGTGGGRLFYLATPPSAYTGIVRALGRHDLARNGTGWARIVVEKPFGDDLASAAALTGTLHEVFREEEIFRIDHYLGKETVQNVLVVRFANAIFEPVWSRQYVDHVQITVAESLGVDERAEYYDSSGAMRDVVQNHLLQLLALVAMEPPVDFEAGAVRDEKVKVLRAIRPIRPDEMDARAIRGQYTEGFIEGAAVPGYRSIAEVAPESRTETFVALKLFVDNWRWEGTPFYLRTGKRMPKRATEIAIQFRAVPHQLFSEGAREGLEPNTLVVRIQPEEGISLKFGAKVPVQGIRIRSVAMDFVYGASFLVDAPDAYETLILDALRGDGTLFTRQDEVEEQWRLVDPVLEAWRASDGGPAPYPAGTWGPADADLFITRDGRRWRQP